MAWRPGAAPDPRGFGVPAARAGARHVMVSGEKMERPAGVAPAFPGWKPGVLLLDHGRTLKNKNKHRCQSGEGLTPAGRFLGGSFGVSGTPPVARVISIEDIHSAEASGLTYLPGRGFGTMRDLQPAIF